MQIQFKILAYLDKQTHEFVTSGNEKKLQRQKGNLEAKIESVHTLITSMVELKMEQLLEEPEITTWSREQEQTLKPNEQSLALVESTLDKIEPEREQRKQQEVEAWEHEKRLRIRKEEDQQRDKLRRIDAELENKRVVKRKAEQQAVKLPKLEISKFKGTPLDWIRFWEQFKPEIDESTMASITKFSYLRELLTEQPRSEILGLPFSEDGYQQAKQILEKKYGVTSEILQAHGKQIMKLPVITSGNLRQIHEFYRTLNVSVNSLKTMGKLDTAEILVRETLEKLVIIKSDLIRTDAKWQECNFEKLLEALREYTLRNPERID